MKIRKLVAATAIAGGFAIASSGLAFASEAHTETSLAPGERVCVNLPATGDAVPVRAEGFGDPGLTFTLTSDGQLVSESADLPVFTSVGATGALEFCATNASEADRFVTLSLTSGRVQDTNPGAQATTVLSAPGPVEVNAPAPDGTSSGTTAGSTAQSVLDRIHQLIDDLLEQVRDVLASVA